MNEDVFRYDSIDQLKQTACFSPVNESKKEFNFSFKTQEISESKPMTPKRNIISYNNNYLRSPKKESQNPVNKRERSKSLREQPKLPPVSSRTPTRKLNLEINSIINVANQYKEDTELQTKIDLLVKNILDIKNVIKKKGRDVQSAPKSRSFWIKK